MDFQQVLIQNHNTFVVAFIEQMKLELQKDGFKILRVAQKTYSKVKALDRHVVECSVGNNHIILKGKNEGVEWITVFNGSALFSIKDTSELKKKLLDRKLIKQKDLQENIDTFTSTNK